MLTSPMALYNGVTPAAASAVHLTDRPIPIPTAVNMCVVIFQRDSYLGKCCIDAAAIRNSQGGKVLYTVYDIAVNVPGAMAPLPTCPAEVVLKPAAEVGIVGPNTAPFKLLSHPPIHDALVIGRKVPNGPISVLPIGTTRIATFTAVADGPLLKALSDATRLTDGTPAAALSLLPQSFCPLTSITHFTPSELEALYTAWSGAALLHSSPRRGHHTSMTPSSSPTLADPSSYPLALKGFYFVIEELSPLKVFEKRLTTPDITAGGVYAFLVAATAALFSMISISPTGGGDGVGGTPSPTRPASDGTSPRKGSASAPLYNGPPGATFRSFIILLHTFLFAPKRVQALLLARIIQHHAALAAAEGDGEGGGGIVPPDTAAAVALDVDAVMAFSGDVTLASGAEETEEEEEETRKSVAAVLCAVGLNSFVCVSTVSLEVDALP